MNETKRKMWEVIDRETWNRSAFSSLYFAARLRFKAALGIFDSLVTHMLALANNRRIITDLQRSELHGMWRRICWPTRPDEETIIDPDTLPADFRWYRRGEREVSRGPLVFANFCGEPAKYFTAVYDGHDPEAKMRFIRDGQWTHWHPLEKRPDVGAEVIGDAVETMTPVILSLA